MRVSDKGIITLAAHEGIVPAPYLDSKGIWTYGVGHTSGAGEPNPATMPKGMPRDLEGAIKDVITLFKKDIRKYEDRVNSAVKVPLKQHQFDALVSFDYNTGGIYKASLTAAINQRDPDAYRLFMNWRKPPEIIPRRESEMELFHKGKYRLGPIPVWGVDSRGKLTRVITTYSGEKLLGLLGEEVVPQKNPFQFFMQFIRGFKR